MAYGFDDYIRMSPVALAELSINRAIATIEGQVALPGFQSDYERASQAIVQIAGPALATARWVNPVGIEMMGAGSLSDAMQRLDALVNSNLVGPMERALAEQSHLPMTFRTRATMARRGDQTASLFISGTITRDSSEQSQRAIMTIVDESAVAKQPRPHRLRSGEWMKHKFGPIVWSPEAYALLGFTPTGGMLTSHDMTTCFVPGDREKFEVMMDSLEHRQSRFETELLAVGSDGFRRALRVTGERRSTGRIEGTVDDVTPYRMSGVTHEKDLLRLTQVLSVLRRIESVRDMVLLTRLVTSKVRELTGADGATFVVREDDRVHYLDENAVRPLWKGQDFDIKSCISGWAMLSEEPAVVADIYNDPRIPIEYYKPTFVQSLVTVPVRAERPGLAIGAYFAKKYAATLDDLAIMRALADSASKAMASMTKL